MPLRCFPSFRSVVALCFGLSLAVGASAQSPRILASIKPLELIAQEVGGERAEIDRLLAPGASPHDYPLRLSEMRRIHSADLVFWVGRDLEAFLHRPVSQLPAEQRLAAGDIEGLHWPVAAEAHRGDGPADRGHSHGELHGHHHHGEQDPHLWLDPRNGARVALALGERLTRLDPEGADGYRQRAERLAGELEALDQSLAERLAPFAERGFAVYHEGYGHFVERYDLKQLSSVTFTPERRPGARHLYQLRQRLVDAVCLFTEPYYDMGSTDRLAEELGLKVGELDLLGASAAVQSYPDLLNAMADEFVRCLSP